jgi:hypothetical protein
MNYANDNSRSALLLARGLTKEAAAEYCGCASLAAFDVWIRKGIVPGAIPGTNRRDRKAIDLALDKASNIETTAPSGSLLAEWKAKKAACR